MDYPSSLTLVFRDGSAPGAPVSKTLRFTIISPVEVTVTPTGTQFDITALAFGDGIEAGWVTQGIRPIENCAACHHPFFRHSNLAGKCDAEGCECNTFENCFERASEQTEDGKQGQAKTA